MGQITKTKEQILAEIMVKVISGQQLTDGENKLLTENESTLKDAATTLKNVSSKVKEAEQAKKLEEYIKKFSTFLESFKKDVSSKTFETGADLKNWLKDQVKNVPVLKNSKGSGSTDWLSPININTVKPNSYNGIIYNFVNDSDKGVTKHAIVDKITEVKGKCTNKAGYMYRVNMALSGKIPGLVYNEKTKLVTLKK